MVGVGVGWWARGRAGARARGRVGAWAARFRPPGAHGARAQPRQGITARRRSLANPGPPQSWRIVVRFSEVRGLTEQLPYSSFAARRGSEANPACSEG
jgi:hypothetical protein